MPDRDSLILRNPRYTDENMPEQQLEVHVRVNGPAQRYSLKSATLQKTCAQLSTTVSTIT